MQIGVESIVLRQDTPIEVRRELGHLLNANHEYKWTVDQQGVVDITAQSCELHRFTNFEALSKLLDNEALGQLVNLELGVHDTRWDQAWEREAAAERLIDEAAAKQEAANKANEKVTPSMFNSKPKCKL